jgi:hypothetical protein
MIDDVTDSGNNQAKEIVEFLIERIEKYLQNKIKLLIFSLKPYDEYLTSSIIIYHLHWLMTSLNLTSKRLRRKRKQSTQLNTFPSCRRMTFFFYYFIT